MTLTDAHFHRNIYDTFLSVDGQEFVFHGFHPWQVDDLGERLDLSSVRTALVREESAGVGEIGLDRLHNRTISDAQRTAFTAQLELAATFGRPVVLHGAKCWGEVVKACQPYAGRIPAFLFHGFSRSAGLLPDIFALNGFVGVGAAVLNDHAVNYRELVKALPPDRLLIETDADPAAADAPDVAAIYAQVANLRGMTVDALADEMTANARRFVEALT